MAREPQHLNTVEELVGHVVGLSSYEQERKWTLHVQRDSHYSLQTASTMWYSSDVLYLSEELGAACDRVWKHGPVYKGSSTLEPKGYMTMAGLLKRLGRGDVGEQIKTAQAVEAERQAKQHRNYARAEIVKHLNEIEKLLDKDGAALGLTKADFMLSEDVTAKLMAE